MSSIFYPPGIVPPSIGLGGTGNAALIARFALFLGGFPSVSTGAAWTPEDMAAAKGWQASRGLSPSGNIDLASWRELLKG